MAALYIISLEKGSGKTALCAGLGKQLIAKGKKIGYFKPLITDAGVKAADADAQLMKQLFSLAEPVEAIAPVIRGNISAGIKEAYARIAQGKDVVIVEGSGGLAVSRDAATALGAKALIIEPYSKELLKTVDEYEKFGASLLGVILNKVPKTRVEQVKTEASAKLGQAKINLLGVLPEDRTLLAMTIGELTASIHGEFFSGAEQSDKLVENLMLGALGLDPGPDYFGRKDRKAVVLKSERPDMQLAALHTSTRCLVLAGNTRINPVVINDAKGKNVPIITAKGSVADLVTSIEGASVKTGFNASKLPRLLELIEQRLDLPKIMQGLG